MISPSAPRAWGLHARSFLFTQTTPSCLLPPLSRSHLSRTTFGPPHSLHFLLSHPIATPRLSRFVVSVSKSPYEILGLPPSASDVDIKRAYRKLALKWHPDVNKAPGAERKFLLIKNAYQTLIDPVSRSEYDFASGNSPEGESEEDYFGIDEFWKDLQFSVDEFVNGLQVDLGMKERSPNKPKSLWEELTEIGGEFVEFIEKELNTLYDLNQPMDEQKSNNGSNKYATDKEREARELEEDINEIEQLLVKLRKELGL